MKNRKRERGNFNYFRHHLGKFFSTLLGLLERRVMKNMEKKVVEGIARASQDDVKDLMGHKI